jgi:acetate kinase
LVVHLSNKEGMTAEEVEHLLNERSGLLGLSGRSRDMREILAAAQGQNDARAALAVDVFCYRVRKYIGAYLAVLGGADAIVFGGGIGERSSIIRSRICADMDWCGLRLDPARNEAAVGVPPGEAVMISADSASLACSVAGVDEEVEIARATRRCLSQ